MTGSNILLDTSIVIELFKGSAIVTHTLENELSVNIPFAVLGELYLGAYRSSNAQKHITQIKDFLTKCNVLIADAETADYYAQIKASLLKKGRPIPENDIWIAATAKQYKLKLITKDKHFTEIEDLVIINW